DSLSYSCTALNLDINVDQPDGCRSYSRNAAGLAERLRTHAGEFLLHFTGETADVAVIEPVGDGFCLGFAHLLNRAPLLIEVAGVLDFCLHRLHLVAYPCGQTRLC